MRYHKELGEEFVTNGTSKVRGHTIETIEHPKGEERHIKIFVVEEIISQSEMNPILPGMMLGLSFPTEKINSRDYMWKPGEERMAPLKIEIQQRR